MRGKKSDSEFISEFITQCVTTGIDTPELIVNYAKNIICGIDEEIKRIEQKKIYRSKVLDVINTFEKTENKNKLEEAKLLSFYKLSHPEICKDICFSLKEAKSLPALSWASFGDNAAEHNFCVKQLLEFKVLAKIGDALLRGDKFEEYLKFLTKDN
jgi:hypothetical protein